MASTTHMATVEDDARHTPGPESRPLWNESYWFPWYDPRHEIGVAIRFGMLPNMGYSNIYVLITQGDTLGYSMIDQRAPIPAIEDGRLSADSYTIEVEKPLERFHLTYDRDGVMIDVIWESVTPTGMWPHPPGEIDQVPRHIEGSGHVRGTMSFGGQSYEIDCPGHRDHSFGGERDWNSFEKWDYLSGDFGPDFWFNAVKIKIDRFPQAFTVGCLWDGKELLMLPRIEMDVEETEAGTRAKSVEVRATDEHGNEHLIRGETFASANVWFGPTCLREGVARWTYNGRTAYGVHEHGYTEKD